MEVEIMKYNNIKLKIPKLTELIKQSTEYIISQGYSESAIKQHIRVWQKLQEFALLHEEEFFSLELAAKFMKEIYKINDIFKPDPRTQRWRVRYVWCLDDFSKNKCFVRHREYNVPTIPEIFTEIYFLYEEYLTNKHQKPRSISTKMARIKIFLLFLNQHGISKTEEVSPDTIINFIETLKYSTAYRGNILITLRDFLKCPTISEFFQTGLVDILKPIHLNRYERLPSFYSNEEINSILLAVDRNTPQGKKDYAIIILAVELGLRVSDIRKLQMNEIKWDKNTIELFQQKTGEFVQLYMTDTVKWAILDYLMKVRPKDSKYSNVFLRSKAPYTPYSKMTSFYEQINKYINLSGIKTEGKHHGLHSCRHGLATRLLNEGVPITVVSEALGHKFANVTKDYIRIDIPQLRLVALEVPSDV
jgi:integrase